MKRIVLVALMLLLRSGYVFGICETPPPVPTTSNLVIAWTDPACTPTSCPAQHTIALAVQAFGFDFSCATYTFDWNFGDGTPITTTSAPTTVHIYNVPGTYTVTVRVARSDAQVTLTRTFVVSEPIPTLSKLSVLGLALFLGLIGLFLSR